MNLFLPSSFPNGLCRTDPDSKRSSDACSPSLAGKQISENLFVFFRVTGTWPLQRGPQIFSPLRGRTLQRGGGEGFGAAGLCAGASPTSPQALS